MSKEIQQIADRAKEQNVYIECVKCPWSTPMWEYVSHDENVDGDRILWECGSCGHDTVDMKRRYVPSTYTVAGIEEMEQMFGE